MDLTALLSEGLRHHTEGRLDSARNIYEELLKRDPRHADALHHLGLINLQFGALSQAIEQIRSSLLSDPSNSSALTNLAHCLNLIGDHQEASKSCEAALELDPDDDAAWTNLGNAQRALGLLAHARESFERALNLKPHNTRYSCNLGIILLDLGNISNARRHFRDCLSSSTLAPLALKKLATCSIVSGEYQSALDYCDSAIKLAPTDAEAWNLRGASLRNLDRYEEAITSYAKAIEIKPNFAEVLNNQGLAFYKLGKYEAALYSYDRAIEVEPRYVAAWSNRGNALNDLGRHEEALASYERAVELKPDYAEAWSNRGNALNALRRHEEALASRDRSIVLKPDYAEAWSNRGAALNDLRRYEEALASYDRAIELKPDFAEAWSNRGNALNDLRRHEEALASCERAIELKPDYAEAWSNRGNALNDLRRHEEALASYDRAIELKPDFAEAWSNRGNALNDLRRHEEALASYDRAIELKPDFAEAWSNRGVTLKDVRRHEEALASYERAIELKPDYAEAWLNRGAALNDLRRHEEALASYERSIALKPDADYILGDLVRTQMKICDWTNLDDRCQTLQSRLFSGDPASSPFAVLGLFDEPHLQRRCAELHAKKKLGFESELGPIGRGRRLDKIRVGYFSMDFREHPVAHLVAELIETHDRDKFEIYGFSFGRDTGDSMRKRLGGAFDKFLEVSHLSEPNIARLARDHGIDIAIDLGGYTQDSRPAIFTHRAAPIQINYLGFPGTMGSSAIDYLIADPVLIPVGSQSAYSEKIIYLPDSYQVNDSKREISGRVFTRQELALPESSFVFCCFNNNWKILPETFDVWIRIIQSLPNSVLWLYEDNPTAARNLQGWAKDRGLDLHRLVFAKRMPPAEHLARYRLADLFLDTFPYGAHTTASDALWAGLPVLTRSGQSFACRVAGSLLHAVGLPELITHTTQEYESLAIELANNPERLSSLKARLAEKRATCPLFNTALFTQHVEAAYQAAYDRYHEGLAPDLIYVSA